MKIKAHPPLLLDKKQDYIRIFGVRRSGNHAISDFIANAYDGRILYLDQCRLPTSPLERFSGYKFDNKVFSLIDKEVSTSRRLYNQRDSVSAIENHIKICDGVIAFFEEQVFADLNIARSGFFSGRSKNIIVIRSFSNWLASAYNHIFIYNPQENYSIKTLGHLCELSHSWVNHANRLLSIDDSQRVMCVIFDEFISNPLAREKLTAWLGLPSTHFPSHDASRFGRGSSFSGYRQQDLLNSKNLTDRISLIKDDVNFVRCLRAILEDPDVREAVQNTFPDDLLKSEKLIDAAVAAKMI